MNSKINGIEHAELVERIFGRWPSFHDAEIHCVSITRDSDAGPQMDVAIHHWEMTSEVDSKGYYVFRHHTLTTLRFSGVYDLQLAGFNCQNALSDLKIVSLADTGSGSCFSVHMPTSFGCEASFECRAIRVLSATPYSLHDA